MQTDQRTAAIRKVFLGLNAVAAAAGCGTDHQGAHSSRRIEDTQLPNSIVLRVLEGENGFPVPHHQPELRAVHLALDQIDAAKLHHTFESNPLIEARTADRDATTSQRRLRWYHGADESDRIKPVWNYYENGFAPFCDYLGLEVRYQYVKQQSYGGYRYLYYTKTH